MQPTPPSPTPSNPAQYWHIDGLVEAGTGLVMFFLGLYNLLLALFSVQLPALWLAVGQPLILLPATFAVREVVRRVRQRIACPHLLYPALWQPPKPNLWMGVLLALSAAVFTLAMTLGSLPYLPEGTGFPYTVALAVLFMLYLGWRLDLMRFYLLALWLSLLGTGIILMEWHVILANGVFLCGAGIGGMISGGWQLLALLHRLTDLRR